MLGLQIGEDYSGRPVPAFFDVFLAFTDGLYETVAPRRSSRMSLNGTVSASMQAAKLGRRCLIIKIDPWQSAESGYRRSAFLLCRRLVLLNLPLLTTPQVCTRRFQDIV